MKELKKVPVIPVIIGVVLLVYGLVSYFVNEGIFSLTDKVGQVVIGVGLISFAILIVVPKINKGTSLSKTLRILEFIVLIVAAVIGFILPLFDINTISLGSGSLWFGLALVIDGAIALYLGAGRKVLFFVSLLSVMLGTWVYATNFIDRNLKMFTFIVLVGLGLYFLILGLLGFSKKSK